jgi:hypothetical protein
MRRTVCLTTLLCALSADAANTTESWLQKRAELIHEVFGYGPGVLSNKSKPDQVLTWPEAPDLQGLVWNMSTVFYSPVTPGKRSKSAFFFHHGHSNCDCPTQSGDPPVVGAKCRPGCKSTMPSGAEKGMSGYSWWDLYNVSAFAHSLGHDIFIFSMPLKGVNLGPGSDDKHLESNHWCGACSRCSRGAG